MGSSTATKRRSPFEWTAEDAAAVLQSVVGVVYSDLREEAEKDIRDLMVYAQRLVQSAVQAITEAEAAQILDEGFSVKVAGGDWTGKGGRTHSWKCPHCQMGEHDGHEQSCIIRMLVERLLGRVVPFGTLTKSSTAAIDRRFDDDECELVLRLMREHLTEHERERLTFTRWKDGIDIDIPTIGMRSLVKAYLEARTPHSAIERSENRPCTCHPDDRPSPCQHKYALNDCRAAAALKGPQ